MPFLLLVVIIGVIAFLLIRRSRELFVVRVTGGRLSRVRGNIPQGLLSAFRDALGEGDHGTIRVSRTPNGAHLTARGMSESVEQRLRNVLGLFPASKLRAAAIDKRQAAHDVLTVAWFLQLFRRR